MYLFGDVNYNFTSFQADNSMAPNIKISFKW